MAALKLHTDVASLRPSETEMLSVDGEPSPSRSSLSLVQGTEASRLWDMTLGSLMEQQATHHGDRTAVVFPGQNVRMSYRELCNRSKLIAKALLDGGIRYQDGIGIMAGNRFEYTEAFVGAARIGCRYVVLNSTYTPDELVNAVSLSGMSSLFSSFADGDHADASLGCKLLFLATQIGSNDMSQHLRRVLDSADRLPDLQRVVLLSDQPGDSFNAGDSRIRCGLYNSMLSNGVSVFMNDGILRRAERRVSSDDIVNLQFTSGTTGSPKAAMLTHTNLINNGRFIGDRMGFSADDVICCPPPLFHCFGLVMGFLCAVAHGCTIVFPSDVFDAGRTLDALERELCTSFYGVPTMFVAALEAQRARGLRNKATSTLKTSLAAGSPVSAPLMRELETTFGIQGMHIAYGMTETSPVTFMTTHADPREKRLTTVGTVFPHTWAKIVNPAGRIVPRGTPGELCTSGFALQRGYWKNEAKTAEVMKRDEDGRLWMHTGDECIIDADGYCIITGRIKDIIIRGGENIFPGEIETRLAEHDGVVEASVVGLKDSKYGEAVACFLRSEADAVPRPVLGEIRSWVQQKLGRHKAPKYIFWLDDLGMPDFPKTGSGKHQKHVLRDVGNSLVKQETIVAKL